MSLQTVYRAKFQRNCRSTSKNVKDNPTKKAKLLNQIQYIMLKEFPHELQKIFYKWHFQEISQVIVWTNFPKNEIIGGDVSSITVGICKEAFRNVLKKFKMKCWRSLQRIAKRNTSGQNEIKVMNFFQRQNFSCIMTCYFRNRAPTIL